MTVAVEHIWYAAYGSNLSRARFGIYLSGGRPAGASHTYPGCRDATPPAADEPADVAAELVFGGSSKTWGGGVAFVNDGAGTTKARLYLVTQEQFLDVVAQENWLDPGSLTLALPAEGSCTIAGQSTYGVIRVLGERDGVPVVTVTQGAGTPPAAPAAAYLRHVAEGLRESHGLSTDEIVAYLAAKRGIAGALDAGAVARALSV